MKSQLKRTVRCARLIEIAVLSGLMLASAAPIFAGGQPAKVYTPAANTSRDAANTARPADERATGAKAPRAEKGAQAAPRVARVQPADSGFRK